MRQARCPNEWPIQYVEVGRNQFCRRTCVVVVFTKRMLSRKKRSPWFVSETKRCFDRWKEVYAMWVNEPVKKTTYLSKRIPNSLPTSHIVSVCVNPSIHTHPPTPTHTQIIHLIRSLIRSRASLNSKYDYVLQFSARVRSFPAENFVLLTSARPISSTHPLPPVPPPPPRPPPPPKQQTTTTTNKKTNNTQHQSVHEIILILQPLDSFLFLSDWMTMRNKSLSPGVYIYLAAECKTSSGSTLWARQ